MHVVQRFLGKGRDSDTDCSIGTFHCYLSLNSYVCCHSSDNHILAS